MLSCRAAKILKKLVHLVSYHVLELIKPVVKNNFSLPSQLLVANCDHSFLRFGLHLSRHI
jgi:hypothetical protein